jgi:hypothetical protein
MPRESHLVTNTEKTAHKSSSKTLLKQYKLDRKIPQTFISEADKAIHKKPHDYEKGKPSKVPFDHENDTSDIESDSGEDLDEHKVEVPFYPTHDGKPPKVPQDKPHKKFNKEDKKNNYNNNVFIPQTHDNNKFNNVNYGDDTRIPPVHQQPGPGFFNPDASKDQFSEHHVDKQLFNILGPNTQNLPPHIRIDQLLQHIQSQDPNGGQSFNLPFQPNQNGINYNQYGESPDHHLNRPGYRRKHFNNTQLISCFWPFLTHILKLSRFKFLNSHLLLLCVFSHAASCFCICLSVVLFSNVSELFAYA